MNKIKNTFTLPILLVGIALVAMGCNLKLNKAIRANSEQLEDGIYLIHRTGNKSSDILPLMGYEKIIRFNKEFYEKTDVDVKYVVIDTREFVPIQLKEKPKTEQQEDKRKKLLLSLTDDAGKELKQFTTRQLNQLTTIVVGGEALTMHKIRVVIDSGLLQVTRCTDNACELLFSELKDNVVGSDQTKR